VDKATGGAQSPWEAYNLYEPFYFIPPAPGVAGGEGGGVADKESLVWQAIAKESDPALFEDYLERYPGGGFAGVAKAKLDKLKAQAKSAKPKPGDIFREPATGMEFVWVEGGCFAMGSPDGETGRYEDEGPVHEVCVDGLWVGKTEVTNRQYRLFAAAHDSKSFAGRSLNNDDQPAANLSWDDARAYAEWLSSKGSGVYRLPTEAEWEHAARGGSAASRFWGDNPADACAYANVSDLAAESALQRSRSHACDDRFAVSSPAASYRPNPYGLYDMLGNVREWCQDVYGEKAYSAHKRDNPAFAGGGSGRVNRGGSWSQSPRDVRAANRKGGLASTVAADLGFRLVRTP
jgi:formylglycine-generating enzyme required for sulfatase activity